MLMSKNTPHPRPLIHVWPTSISNTQPLHIPLMVQAEIFIHSVVCSTCIFHLCSAWGLKSSLLSVLLALVEEAIWSKIVAAHVSEFPVVVRTFPSRWHWSTGSLLPVMVGADGDGGVGSCRQQQRNCSALLPLHMLVSLKAEGVSEETVVTGCNSSSMRTC